ncbi:vesicle coat component [Savitreella phatthalungensis]
MQFTYLLNGLLAFATLASALKFDLEAHRPGFNKQRCIRDYVAGDVLVVVTAWVSDGSNAARDAVRTDIEISDSLGNQYARPRNVWGESRSAFTVHEAAYVKVCFDNVINQGYPDHAGSGGVQRHIELDVDIGADALDWSAIQKAEKLGPLEADLRRAEGLMGEVVAEMEYLRAREQRLRDTNESTNDRVKGFAFLSLIVLLGTGVWQVVYLRRFFQRKHLI